MKKLTLILSLAMLSLVNLSSALTLYWDGGTTNISPNGDGISQGASGTWNTALQNWDAGVSPHVAWTGGADAVFGADGIVPGAGIVTLGSAITANSITVTSTNYSIGNGGVPANTLTMGAVSNSVSIIIGANVVNSSGFTMNGISTLSLTNANTGLTGGLTINSGTLQLGNTDTTSSPNSFGSVSVVTNSTLALQSGANITYAQTISGAGAVAITDKSSSIATTLTGANTHSGGTIVHQANVKVGSIDDVNPSPLGTGSLQICNGSSATIFTYDFPGGDTTTTRPLIFGGTGISRIDNTSSGTLTLAGPISFTANATSSKTISLGGNMPSIIASVVPDNITATSTNPTKLQVRNTGGYWMLTGNNTFSGGIEYFGGGSGNYKLVITNDAALGNPTNVIICTTNGSASSASSGEIDSTNFPVVLASTRTITFSGPNTAGVPTMVFKTLDTNSLTIGAYITGGGNVKRKSATTLVAGVAGPVRFANDTNDFAGIFTAEIGATEFTSVANSGVASSLGRGVTNSGIITLNNASSVATFRYVGTTNNTTTRALDWSGTTGTLHLDASGAGTIQYLATANLKSGAGSAILTLDGSNTGNNTLAQVVNNSSGTVSLQKADHGTWVLTGANTYTGPTAIQEGTLTVSSINSVNGGTPLLSSSSLGAPTTIADGTIGLGFTWRSGSLNYVGVGETSDRVLDLAGTNGGAMVVQSGTGLLKFTSNLTASGDGSKTLTLGGSSAGSGEIAGVVPNSASGTTALTKTGTGKWTLSGANTFTGDTTISGGTLALGSSGSIAGSSNIIINGGATLDVSAVGGGYSLLAGQTLWATNEVTATNSGSLNLSAAGLMLSYSNGVPALDARSGALTLSAGTPLTIAVANAGVLLPGGTYKLISKSSGGSVAGTVPASVILTGDVTNTATVNLTGGELFLTVPSATLYAPTLTGISLTGGNAVLSFIGTNGQTYQILSSTNLITPRSNWTVISSGTFTGLPMTYTNGPMTNSRLFYLLTSP